MATDTQLTGANSPLELSNREFSARTLRDRDYSEINEWIRSQIINGARASLDEFMTTAERQEFLVAAVQASAGITWADPEGARVMHSVEGQVRLAWQMTKHESRLNFKQFEKIVRSEDEDLLRRNLENINLKYTELNTDFSKKKNEDGNGEPEEGSPEETKSK